MRCETELNELKKAIRNIHKGHFDFQVSEYYRQLCVVAHESQDIDLKLELNYMYNTLHSIFTSNYGRVLVSVDGDYYSGLPELVYKNGVELKDQSKFILGWSSENNDIMTAGNIVEAIDIRLLDYALSGFDLANPLPDEHSFISSFRKLRNNHVLWDKRNELLKRYEHYLDCRTPNDSTRALKWFSLIKVDGLLITDFRYSFRNIVAEESHTKSYIELYNKMKGKYITGISEYEFSYFIENKKVSDGAPNGTWIGSKFDAFHFIEWVGCEKKHFNNNFTIIKNDKELPPLKAGDKKDWVSGTHGSLYDILNNYHRS